MANGRTCSRTSELKSFEKIWLAPGEQTTLTMTLDRDAFTYYDPDADGGDGAWVLEPARPRGNC